MQKVYIEGFYHKSRMGYEKSNSRLRGYGLKYVGDVVKQLTKYLQESKNDNRMSLLWEIGNAVFDKCEDISGRLKDGDIWFGGLQVRIDGKNLCIYFPWDDDKKDVEVLSQSEVPEEKVKCSLEAFIEKYKLRTA